MELENRYSGVSFPAKLKELRKKKGLNQAQLGEMLGKKANTISNYEKGISTPGFDVIDKLIDILETSRSELFNEVEEQSPKKDTDAFGILEELEIKYPQERDSFRKIRNQLIDAIKQVALKDQKIIEALEQRNSILEVLEKEYKIKI